MIKVMNSHATFESEQRLGISILKLLQVSPSVRLRYARRPTDVGSGPYLSEIG
jgi:hypothetical protein